jgi:DNA-binding Xre family transcriptional regulator
MTFEVKRLVDTFKKHLKSSRITYAELAQRTDMTEAAIKGLFHRESLTLSKFAELCAAVGLTIADVVAIAELESKMIFELSESQEELLVNSPKHFQVFRSLMHDNVSPDQLRQSLGISDHEYSSITRDLENWKLVERLPGDAIKCLLKGALQWRLGGPWMKRNYLAWSERNAKIVIQRPDDASTFCRFGFFRLDDSLRDRFFLDLAALQASYVNLANHRHALGLNDSNGLYWKLEVVGESLPYVAELEFS